MTANCRKRINAGAIAIGLFLAMSISGCGGGTSPTETAVANGTQMRALSVSTPVGVTVVSLTKVSEARISRTVYDYVFKITVKNDSIAKTAIMATATGAGSGTTIFDGSVLVGDMAANAAVTPSDTITLRHDRVMPFKPSALVWQISEPINGFPVPPDPNPITNGSTLGGVDTNSNGVRDDVERLLAGITTTQADFVASLNYASAYQALITSLTPTSRADALIGFSRVACRAQRISSAVRNLRIEDVLADTADRKSVLADFFAVLIAISSKEILPCEK